MRQRRHRGAAALAALLAVFACASAPEDSPDMGLQRHRISVVGAFDDYNEVLRGTGVSDPGLRAHFIDLKGVVPQNVNYALRSDFVMQLLHRGLGDDLETATRSGDVKATELISQTEGSVVLVIAR
jgi:hypothetical protein